MKQFITLILFIFSVPAFSQVDSISRVSIDLNPTAIIRGELPIGVTIYKKNGKRAQLYGGGPVFYDFYNNGRRIKYNKSGGAMVYSAIRFNREKSFIELRNENKFVTRNDIIKIYGKQSLIPFGGSKNLCEDCASIQTEKVLVNKALVTFGYRGGGKRIYFEPYLSLGVKLTNTFADIHEIYDFSTQQYFRFNDYNLNFNRVAPTFKVGFSTGVKI